MPKNVNGHFQIVNFSTNGANTTNTFLYAPESITYTNYTNITVVPSSFQVTLVSPSDNTLITSIGSNFTANYSLTNSNISNATYFVWFSNSTLFNQSTRTVTGNTTNTTTLFIDNFLVNNYIWNVYACGRNSSNAVVCNWGTNITFSIGASLNSLTYLPTVYETSNQRFRAIYNLLSGSQISLAKLNYNNVNYSISNITQNSTAIVLDIALDIPLNRNPFLNQTNNFTFIFTYSGDVIQNSDRYYQNVSFINLQLCNATYTTMALNFTLYDEINNTYLNATRNPVNYETTFNYFIGSGTVYKNYSYSTLNNNSKIGFAFCIYPYNSSINFTSDMDTEYSASGYVDNEYHLRDASLTSNAAPYTLYLYSLVSSAATKFYITFRENVLIVENAVVTASKYFLGIGTYQNVAMRVTDSSGKIPIYLEIDKDYIFSVVKDGVLIGVINRKATCLSEPCTMDINIDETTSNIFEGYNDLYASNVLSNVTFNRTSKIVSYNFIDTTGLAHYFRLKVTQGKFSGVSVTVCDTFAYTSVGSITCNMTNYDGDFNAIGYISRSPEKIDKILSFVLDPNAIEQLGIFTILLTISITAIFVFAMAVISRGSPSAVIFSLAIAILFLKIMHVFPFSWVVTVGLEALFFYLLIRMKT